MGGGSMYRYVTKVDLPKYKAKLAPQYENTYANNQYIDFVSRIRAKYEFGMAFAPGMSLNHVEDAYIHLIDDAPMYEYFNEAIRYYGYQTSWNNAVGTLAMFVMEYQYSRYGRMIWYLDSKYYHREQDQSRTSLTPGYIDYANISQLCQYVYASTKDNLREDYKLSSDDYYQLWDLEDDIYRLIDSPVFYISCKTKRNYTSSWVAHRLYTTQDGKNVPGERLYSLGLNDGTYYQVWRYSIEKPKGCEPGEEISFS